MTTIKSYTDIEQSKKLAEFLPLESADMKWFVPADDEDAEEVSLIENKSEYTLFDKVTDWDDTPYLPCWSLAALLGVLPSVIKRNGKRMFLTLEKADAYNLYYKSPDRLDELWETKEDVIEVCYEMIINLHELKIT